MSGSCPMADDGWMRFNWSSQYASLKLSGIIEGAGANRSRYSGPLEGDGGDWTSFAGTLFR